MNQQYVKKSLYNSLRELGLTELEINLYVVSLALGPCTISKIAEHLGISRPNVYKVIAGLEKHELAKPYNKVKYSRQFIVESPAFILEKLRKKKNEIAKLDGEIVGSLPELISMYNQGTSPTKIKIFQGREQFVSLFDQSLEESRKEIKYFGEAQNFIEFIGWGVEMKWRKKRIRKNIFIKVLAPPNQILENFKDDEKEQRETRILKGVWPFVTSYMIFANKVMIFQPKAPLVVLIEDQYIVDMLSSSFDWMWEKSK